MSRYYEMSVTIKGFQKDRQQHVEDAANSEWSFEDWYASNDGNEVSATGRSNLCGGESEDDFSARLALAVWEANGGPCVVELTATYLDDLPHETYYFNPRRPPFGYNPPKGPLHECQDCGKLSEEGDLHPIKDIAQRVAPGEPMPSGECPSCGALCHQRKDSHAPVTSHAQQ